MQQPPRAKGAQDVFAEHAPITHDELLKNGWEVVDHYGASMVIFGKGEKRLIFSPVLKQIVHQYDEA